MKVPFSKFSACGNDFIVIDHRRPFFPVENFPLIANLCHRRTGIGADGIILLESSQSADYRMRIFNADGSEAEMCGNGIRCLYPFLRSLDILASEFWIETMHRRLRIAAHKDLVAVEMGAAMDLRWDIDIPDAKGKRRGHYLNTGVPHLVIFGGPIHMVDVENEGRSLRHHELFAPQGVNVNFVEQISGGVAVRTYERGVEAETLSCGTGATAAALAVAKLTGASSPISVRTQSGEYLNVSFQRQGDQFQNIELCGPAICVYHGEVSLFNPSRIVYDDVAMTC